MDNSGSTVPYTPAPAQPPQAKKHPVTRSFHGRDFVDNYEWLRDKEAEDTLAYLQAENAYTDAQTEHLTGLRDNIYSEITSRIKQTDMSVPTRAGDYWYYGRTEEGKDYGYSCRIPVEEGTDPWTPPSIPDDGPVPGEEILLDLNALAEGHEFFSLGASTVTTSGRYLAYSVDTAGDERFHLYVKDLQTGDYLADELTGIFYGASWVGEDYIFYQRVDEAWRPDTVWRHRIGTPQSEDVLVFQEKDERYNVGVGATRSEKYLMIVTSSKITSEVWVLDYNNPEGEFECLWAREPGVEYEVDHAVVAGADYWIVTHNTAGANFAVSTVPVPEGCGAGHGGGTGAGVREGAGNDGGASASVASASSLPGLRELPVLLAHDAEVRIEDVDAYRDFLVLSYRRGAIPRAAIMMLDSVTDATGDWGSFQEIEFEEELFTVGVAGNPEWDAPVIRLGYTSFTQPAHLYDYRPATGVFTLLKRQEVLGGYDASNYTAYRLWTTARDGTEIPVSIIHHADLDTSTPTPTLLYGYGSYESSTDPGFSISRLSLLDRGMIFAIAHVRGGGEMGRGWYDNGKMDKKKNTFFDFIDVADDLVSRGLSAPETMVAEGGSAGGMLMGAIANMAPDRFAGIAAIVPFVDPLTSMLKPELPLTVVEWDEWGDPYHDPDYYDYMASYAPYENITDQRYPDILAVTSLNDTRVLYVEPAKWIAKLREIAGGGEFLLQTEMAAGHGGVSGRYGKWKQTAFEYAWTINKATGITE